MEKNHPSNPIDRYRQTHPLLTGGVLERHGCPIHYWTGGSANGPVMLLMHGAAMDHRMFNDQVEAFAGDYRLVVWDARGHGKSQPVGIDNLTMDDYIADATALLDHLQTGPVILVGQSMGAYIAQHLVRQHPERVRALVIIGSTPVAFPVSGLEMAMLRFSLRAFAWWPYGALTQMMADYTAVRPEVQAYALDAARQVDQKTFVKVWGAVNLAVRQEGYPDFRIGVPFLLTHGERDGTGTIRRDGPRWAASDPAIQYQVIPQAGHNANQDNAEYFNRVLAQFLEDKLQPPR